MMCGPRKTGTESEMIDEIGETFTDLDEAPTKRTRGVPRKPRVPRKKPPPACIPSTETNMRWRLTTSLNNVMRLNSGSSRTVFVRVVR